MCSLWCGNLSQSPVCGSWALSMSANIPRLRNVSISGSTRGGADNVCQGVRSVSAVVTNQLSCWLCGEVFCDNCATEIVLPSTLQSSDGAVSLMYRRHSVSYHPRCIV
eukprot:GFYU01031931.1.p2 GENE.GFYU01031931.1~~GFYU01031931.1.p2  ORF type:complete len:108 (-),score=7.04 GFYU01031931.1:90-413(-)